MEDHRIAADQLPAADKENVSRILERIVADGKTYNDYLINDKHQNKKILAVLLEEYITQQRAEFTLKGLYAYIIYWGMEDHRILRPTSCPLPTRKA